MAIEGGLRRGVIFRMDQVAQQATDIHIRLIAAEVTGGLIEIDAAIRAVAHPDKSRNALEHRPKLCPVQRGRLHKHPYSRNLHQPLDRRRIKEGLKFHPEVSRRSFRVNSTLPSSVNCRRM